jgi:hypothetical protein
MMSIRIETIEQLRDSSLVEKVLDRLRRTTNPRNFAFKKRCKVLDGKPVLITAPPGRKVKSSLLRNLRLGTPTLKGIVHREQQTLVFTFNKDVNKSDTARWISKCMHDAKSPVPLKHIIILGPKDKNSAPMTDEAPLPQSSSEENPKTALEHGDPILDQEIEEIEEEIKHTTPFNVDFEEEEEIEVLSTETLREPSTLDELAVKHISSKKITWLEDTEFTIQNLENQIQSVNERLEMIEEQLNQSQTEKFAVEKALDTQVKTSKSPQENPWTLLIQDCMASSMTLDGFREVLDQSMLATNTLLKELQFLSDDDEMLAWKTIRLYCIEMGTQWTYNQHSDLWKTLNAKQSKLIETEEQLESDLNEAQTLLETLEVEQSTLLAQFASRKLSVYNQLYEILKVEPSKNQMLLETLQQRKAMCEGLLEDNL